MARCANNRVGNRSRCRLAESGRRAARYRMAPWCLDCKVLVATEPAGCILLSLRMLKRKFWVNRVRNMSASRPERAAEKRREEQS